MSNDNEEPPFATLLGELEDDQLRIAMLLEEISRAPSYSHVMLCGICGLNKCSTRDGLLHCMRLVLGAFRLLNVTRLDGPQAVEHLVMACANPSIRIRILYVLAEQSMLPIVWNQAIQTSLLDAIGAPRLPFLLCNRNERVSIVSQNPPSVIVDPAAKDEKAEPKDPQLVVCAVCLERKRNMAYGCGHIYCSTCTRSILQHPIERQPPACPECRAVITMTLRVYL